jgi:hypothetical protein
MAPTDDQSDWRETVRDIYDRLYDGPGDVFSDTPALAQDLLRLIEERHPGFFGALRR